MDGAPAHHLWFYQNASAVNTSARVGMHYTSNVYAPVASCADLVGAAVKTRDTSSHGASGRTDKPEAVGARVGSSASSSPPAQAARSFESMYAPKSSSATAPGSSSSCDRWPRPYHCMTSSSGIN